MPVKGVGQGWPGRGDVDGVTGVMPVADAQAAPAPDARVAPAAVCPGAGFGALHAAMTDAGNTNEAALSPCPVDDGDDGLAGHAYCIFIAYLRRSLARTGRWSEPAGGSTSPPQRATRRFARM